jgi:hypothetical protein
MSNGFHMPHVIKWLVLNGHVSLNDWLESGYVSLKNHLVAHVVAYATFLYEYEWM